MKNMRRLFWLTLGLTVGITATFYLRPAPQPVWAGNDRHEDYIMTTGPIMLGPNYTADGIWLLDYRAGKLLGTMVDRNVGKIVGWAEVDLVKEFNIPAKQNVHFMMTTGTPIANYAGVGGGFPGGGFPGGGNPGQAKGGAGIPGGGKGGGYPGLGYFGGGGANIGNAALYLTEIHTGRFGIYTMAPRGDGSGGMVILKHDATLFRAPAQ